MLFKHNILQRIKTGEVMLAFRKWQYPAVKSGSTLRTAIGVLDIKNISPVELDEIQESDAVMAGYSSRKQLIKALNQRNAGTIYRIEVQFKGPDPRKILQEKDELSNTELNEIRKKLNKKDKKSIYGPWTQKVLEGINAYPEVKSAELSKKLGVEKEWLKQNVRKLKELGLTISLSKGGYQLSPRGNVVLEYLKNTGRE